MTGRATIFPLVALTALGAIPVAGEPRENPALENPAQSELREVPRPVLDNLEAPVREQLIADREALDQALAAYRTTSAFRADLAAAFGALGRIYYLNDFIVAAEVCFLNAVELTPEVFDWHYFLGVLYPVAGRLEDAEARLKEALELRSDYVPALIRLGRVELDLGRVDLAVNRFEAALAADPENAAALQGLGRAAFDRGDFPRAIERFERALELEPEANLIHHQLGLAYRELGDRERALEHLKLNRHQDTRLDDPLISNLRGIVRSAELHFNRAIELLEQDRPEQAVEQLRTAIAQRPERFIYHHNLAAALGLLGRDDEAMAEYRRVLELNPEYPNAHFNLAMMLVRRNEIAEAARYLELAHHFDPRDLEAHTEWATALSRLGQPERAAEELVEVLDQDPSYGRALLNLATVEAQIGRTAAAEATLRRLLEGDAAADERAAANYRLGRMYEERGDVASAFEVYSAAIESDDGLAEAHAALAVLLARRQEFAAAADHFGRAAALDPDDLSAHFGQALALILVGSYAEARATLEASVVLHPEHPPLVHLLARLLATAPVAAVRDGERALKMARRVFALSGTIDHGETISMALAELGRFDEAAAWQREILAEARRRSDAASLATAERRLSQYERREPVRAPWHD